MIVQGMWETESPLKQIPHFNSEILHICEEKKIETVYDIMALEDDERDEIMKPLDENQLASVAEFVNKFPNIEISYNFANGDDTVIAGTASQIIVEVQRDQDMEDLEAVSARYPKIKTESWWVVIGETKTKNIYAIKKATIAKESQQIKMDFTVPSAGKHNLSIWCVCDSYIDADKEISFELDVADSDSDEFFIDDLPVIFPYPRIYPEQYAYMCDIKRTLDVGGNCILEMPSGTGKTVSLLSLTVAYQMFYPEHRKIIYCSRTMSEIEKALIELQKLMDYRSGELGYVEDFRGLGLTSRKNLCLHPIASRERKGIVVDETCRRMTNGQLKQKIEREEASVEDLCSFHEKLYEKDPHNLIPPGVYSFDSLIKFCKKEGTCPYFTVRRMMPFCNIIIYSYHYLLDPKIGERVSKELSKDSIVIFDEAHNIDNVCIESLSLDVTDDILKRASKGANSLAKKIDEVKQHDSKRLQDEYESLVEGLRESGISQGEETFMANPVLSEDVLDEAVPDTFIISTTFKTFNIYREKAFKILF
ncbi:unnamed protein product [[Candida] boidinii]|nr:unnamed protein product [[Candida] boidinii]